MSGDEVFATVLSVITALVAWALWYAKLAAIRTWRNEPAGRHTLGLMPLACAGLILLVLATIASADVVNDPKYILMYLVMGMACIGIVAAFAPALGISYRQDALERHNAAAAAALSGLLLGAAACYAGGNVGNGPGWWVVVFCAALANGALLLAWLILEMLTGISDSITLERDRASGLRLMGFLIGTGLILGRAVAGDWVSAEATIRDFAIVAWPAVVLLAVATIVELVHRPGPNRAEHGPFHAGWVPLFCYVGFGVCYVILCGMPPGGVQ